jgi:hypothetical protein
MVARNFKQGGRGIGRVGCWLLLLLLLAIDVGMVLEWEGLLWFIGFVVAWGGWFFEAELAEEAEE